MADKSSTLSKARIAAWICRIAFTAVFLINMQCALLFCFDPASYAPGFQLPLSGDALDANDAVLPETSVSDGVLFLPSLVAVQGLGVAFIMWNATYPAFIVSPRRFKVLGWVVIFQQVIGLLGESLILTSIQDAGFEILRSSIARFVAFDGIGLVFMLAAFVFLLATDRTAITEEHNREI